MYWLSGAEAEKLVKSVDDANKKVIKAGPNPIKLTEIQIAEEEAIITPPE